MLGSSAYWFTYSWLPKYLQQQNMSIAKSSVWIIVNQIGGIAGLLSFGYIADKFGRRQAFSGFAISMAVGLVMISIFWNNIANYPPLIFVFMFIVGIGTGIYGGYGPLVSELFSTEIRSTAMGSGFNIARGTQFLDPNINSVNCNKLWTWKWIIFGLNFCFECCDIYLDLPRNSGH
jgi:MFS family permease